MTLVDTSVWIAHLRTPDLRLAELLWRGRVLGHSFVIGENACGGLRDRAGWLRLLAEVPGAFVWIGNGPAEGGRELHSPHYDFNDAILPVASRYLAEVAKRALAGRGRACGPRSSTGGGGQWPVRRARPWG